MATQKVGRSKAAEPLGDRKLAALCAEWATLDAERLEFDRQSRTRSDQMRVVQHELEQQLRSRGVATIDLARFELGFQLIDGSLFYKQALIDEIGRDAFDARVAALPKREKFFLREKERPQRATRSQAA